MLPKYVQATLLTAVLECHAASAQAGCGAKPSVETRKFHASATIEAGGNRQERQLDFSCTPNEFTCTDIGWVPRFPNAGKQEAKLEFPFAEGKVLRVNLPACGVASLKAPMSFSMGPFVGMAKIAARNDEFTVSELDLKKEGAEFVFGVHLVSYIVEEALSSRP